MLPALERSRRLERRFKLAILALTVAGVVGLIGGSSAGRSAVARLANRVRWGIPRLIGYPADRREIDAELRLKRAEGIEQKAEIYRGYFEDEATPEWRRVLEAAGMAPRDALVRWADLDGTVMLSSKVFEVDDSGRSYRLRPKTRSLWTSSHVLTRGLAGFFFLPDTPEVRSALAEARVDILPGSTQTTNSWGFRGLEPDPGAKARVMVIGDSFMQGMLVAEDETPPACLARALREAWGVPVSVLNTGHIGYSPEQYYHTLLEYFDRFRPHYVVVSVCPNDFGNSLEVLEGGGDWAEGMYWINAIEDFCRSRWVRCLLVPVPFELQVTSRGYQGHYPGRLSDLSTSGTYSYLNPVEAFTDEHLRLVREGKAIGKRPQTSPLFNGHLYDGHFSARGSSLWAREVGRRITRLGDPSSEPATPGRR